MNVTATYRLGNEKMKSRVHKINKKTVLVYAPKREKKDDGSYKIIPHEFNIIKRHIKKHCVELEGK